ncbi:lytic transglycosylase [Rhodoferax koreense]|uniref:Lytic transglycosylase n=1 Tax=Rhodoferax koreensis TaxID=1842727 RepID=A0A1P8JV35_9BURK|nr:lytic transglycosylase domain-containing protein [Rhodoferax koreense]APW37602.1 lytic transglycosylase [Rhodoferax koreense]
MGSGIIHKISSLRRVGLCLSLLFLQQAAMADVWGYIDAKGVAHFDTQRVDERYELFFKGGESFDTAQMPLLSTGQAPVIGAAPPKLLAFFDISPSYKLVKHHLREAATTHGIDYELLQALIVTESGFSSTAVSPKGAVGLMQIMPATAERYGLAGDAKASVEQKLTDPKTNIRIGTRYLRDLIAMFPGQLDLAVASYNAGEGAVQRAGNRIPNYKETQAYVKTVLSLYNGLKPPDAVVELRRRPLRVRMELNGGAAGRGNLPGGLPGIASSVLDAVQPTVR